MNEISTGYYEVDLTVDYVSTYINPKKEKQSYYDFSSKTHYTMYYLKNGEADIVIGEDKSTIKSKTLAICEPNKLFLIKPKCNF